MWGASQYQSADARVTDFYSWMLRGSALGPVQLRPTRLDEDMKRLAIIGALGGTMLAITSTAQAHVNVDIGIGVPGVVYAEPAPVYAPPPVYVAPQPVYVPRPVVVAPAPVYAAPYWAGRDDDDDDDRGERRWRRRGHREHGEHGEHGRHGRDD